MHNKINSRSILGEVFGIFFVVVQKGCQFVNVKCHHCAKSDQIASRVCSAKTAVVM